MDKINEVKKLRIKLLAALMFLLIGFGCMYFSQAILEPHYTETKANLAATSTLAKKIISVDKEAQRYQSILDESGKIYGNLVSEKEEYISYLGEITMANNLKINKMTVDDIIPAGNELYSMAVEIEVQGNLYNVKNLVHQLYDSGTVSRINSFSYRLQNENGDLQWMWRSIDDEQLVPWWGLEGGDAKSNVTSNSNEEDHVLCADDLLAHGTALCYLRIEFLGTEG